MPNTHITWNDPRQLLITKIGQKMYAAKCSGVNGTGRRRQADEGGGEEGGGAKVQLM
jgi:hypothetical protein